MDELCSAIAARFAGARAELVDGAVEVALEVDEVPYRARLERAPIARVVVALPPTDGFELAVKWNDRWANDGTPRAASFDDTFLVETNDVALASLWLDHETRTALLASRYVSTYAPGRNTAELVRDGGWIHEVRRDEVSAWRRDGAPSADRMVDMLAASLALASWPVRWAKVFAQLARAIGGEPASRIELAGNPVLRVRRATVDVLVHLVRRLGATEAGRLRTIVGAHRHGSGGETLSLISDGLPRSSWPPPADPSCGTLVIDRRAAELLDRARPSATNVRPHDVQIAFDGALTDPDRLGAAIELAAWWASSESASPYR